MVELATIPAKEVNNIALIFLAVGVLVILIMKIWRYVIEELDFEYFVTDMILLVLAVLIGINLMDMHEGYKIVTINEETPYHEVVETYEVIDRVDSVYFVRDKEK